MEKDVGEEDHDGGDEVKNQGDEFGRHQHILRFHLNYSTIGWIIIISIRFSVW